MISPQTTWGPARDVREQALHPPIGQGELALGCFQLGAGVLRLLPGGGRIDFANLQMERGFSGIRQYCNTKLMNLLFAFERLNWLGDVSPKGLQQSAGIMVNYLYRLSDIEANHEAYRGEGRVAASAAVRALARAG